MFSKKVVKPLNYISVITVFYDWDLLENGPRYEYSFDVPGIYLYNFYQLTDFSKMMKTTLIYRF